MAHLETQSEYFAFCSLSQEIFFAFCSLGTLWKRGGPSLFWFRLALYARRVRGDGGPPVRWLNRATRLVCAAAAVSTGFPNCIAAQAQPQTPAAKTPVGPPAPAAPQSTHYPILLVATGSVPGWSARIGMKGLERLERAGYPPIVLEPAEITQEAAANAWVYAARDLAAGAEVTVHLTRAACADGAGATKYTFAVVLNHTEIGELKGCARIAPEEFPEFKQKNLDEDDPAKKKPALPGITKFAAPVAVAFVDPAGRVVFSRGGVKKIAAAKGSEPAVSHDGRKLLYTRSDSKTGPERTIVLYEWETGRSKDLQHGLVRQAFWSPDDSRVAYLNGSADKWQVWSFPVAAPEKAAAFAVNDVTSLHGWSDVHTVLAADGQSLYWISEDKPQQALALKELYGNTFQIMSSDTIRMNPANGDLLLVSANYASAATGTPTDGMDLAAGFFLYEVRSKRRTLLSPTDQWARGGEWSRDGLQVFYTRRVNANVSTTFRIFWDGSGLRRYQDGTELAVGQ